MSRHDLKVWPSYFEAIADGTKTFEVRRNDRDFKVGDRLDLREFDPSLPSVVGFVKGAYTGRKVSRWVNFLYALPPECNYHDGVSRVVMSLGLMGLRDDEAWEGTEALTLALLTRDGSVDIRNHGPLFEVWANERVIGGGTSLQAALAGAVYHRGAL